MGLLKNSVPQVRCLSALQVGSVGQKNTSQLKATGCNTSYISPPRRSSQALLEHGLAPAMPLTPSADQWPLHAAARHNCLPVVQACWLCRQRCQIAACYTLVIVGLPDASDAQVLLVAKADPFARNVRGLTALDVAKNSRPWRLDLCKGCWTPINL